MGLRVQTQAATLRTQRQLAESQGHPADLATPQKSSSQKTSKLDQWPNAADTCLSGNLRAELRTVTDARLAALADMTTVEQHEWDVRTAGEALDKLRHLASLHADTEETSGDGDRSLQYQVLQDQIQRAVVSRAHVERAQSAAPEEIVIGEDYFASEAVPELQHKPWQASSPSVTERALGQLDEYKSYVKAIQKRLLSRFDRLAVKTRQLCETEQAIDTDSFACDVAMFTQQRILGAADLSLKSHDGLVPKVALSLITP